VPHTVTAEAFAVNQAKSRKGALSTAAQDLHADPTILSLSVNHQFVPCKFQRFGGQRARLIAGYAATALAGYGPDERDTKEMADSLRWSEESVGLLILAPALLDAYRYKHPKAKWAKHASRITKLLIIGLVLEADGYTDPS